MADTVVTAPALEVAQRTDPGRDPDKQVNEDACTHIVTPLGYLCVVCDGMGGHVGGRDASNLAIKIIVEHLRRASPNAKPSQALRDAIAEANKRVRGLPGDDASGRPGSTVVATLTHPRGTEIAHVGDSRCYYVHSAQIVQVTKDHSMVQEMVDRGLLTADEAKGHPEANKITRALGMDSSASVEVRPEPVAHVAGDAFVLCSDGLCDLVDPADILRVVGTVPPAQAVGQLVDLANARGGYDNITVIVARIKESAIPSSVRELPATIAQTAPPGPAAPRRPVSHAPDSGGAERRSRGPLLVLLVALLLAVAIGVAYLVIHLQDRRGHRHHHHDAGFWSPTSDAGDADVPSRDLEPAPPPTASAPEPATNDLPPLAPAASTGSKSR